MDKIWRSHYSYIFILILVSFITFWPALRFDFIPTNDDGSHLLSNPQVRSLSLSSILSTFHHTNLNVYIPLTVLSFAIEYHFFKFNPFVFHLNNIILHALVVVLLYWLGIRLGLQKSGSFLAALLFSIHPMKVESVVWVTERKDVLYAVLYVSAMHCYLSFLEHRRKRFYVLTLLCGLLSMCAKPMAVTLPVMLLLCDWFKSRRDYERCLIEKIPFGIYSFLLAIITVRLNPDTLAVSSSLGKALLIWVWSFSFYITKYFYPDPLTILYRIPEPVSLANPAYAGAMAIVLMIASLCFICHRNKLIIYSIMFFVVGIFIILRFDFIGFNVVADRFSYLPSYGLGLTAILLLKELFQQRWGRVLGASLVIFFVLLCVVKTRTHMTVWKNEMTLWDYVVSVLPDCDTAYGNRGVALQKLGFYQLALNDYDKAVNLSKDYSLAYSNRGVIYEKLGKPDLAEINYDEAIKTDPNNCVFYFNKANLFKDNYQTYQAIHLYNDAISYCPNYAEAYNSRGSLLTGLGRYEEAIADFSTAIQIEPYFMMAYNNRAVARIAFNNDYEAAVLDFSKAIEINPYYLECYKNRAHAYILMGEKALAESDYQKVYELTQEIY